MDATDSRRVIIDTDTAGDDTQALLMAATSDRLTIEGVTIACGNVPFDRQVENAKYTLGLVDNEAPVYEGARTPLQKDFKHAEYVHGEGGLGGELFPETGRPSADQHAAEYIVEAAREHPGEITLVCIAPLTNVALALQLEPELGDLLDEVWVMGGNVNYLGNVTPAAEFNFWVDPDAAAIVLQNLEVTLIDWGLTERDATFDEATLDEIVAGPDTDLTEFFEIITSTVREFNRERSGKEKTTQPDSVLTAGLIDPSLIEQSGRYHVAVDPREGLTRGYTAVDVDGVTDAEPNARVIESIDGDRFEELLVTMLFEGTPDKAL